MEITRELVLIIAMVCITVLGMTALAMGFNGTLFTGIVGAIVTIAGYLFTKTTDEVALFTAAQPEDSTEENSIV